MCLQSGGADTDIERQIPYLLHPNFEKRTSLSLNISGNAGSVKNLYVGKCVVKFTFRVTKILNIQVNNDKRFME